MELQQPKTSLHDILNDPTIPSWKKDLIIRKRNTNRLLFGNLKYACASSSSTSQQHVSNGLSVINTPTSTLIRSEEDDDACSGDVITNTTSTISQNDTVVSSCSTTTQQHQEDLLLLSDSNSSSYENNTDKILVLTDQITNCEAKKEEEETEDFHLVTLLNTEAPAEQNNGDFIEEVLLVEGTEPVEEKTTTVGEVTTIANYVPPSVSRDDSTSSQVCAVHNNSNAMRLNDNNNLLTTKNKIHNNNSDLLLLQNNNNKKNNKNSKIKQRNGSNNMGEEKLVKMKNSSSARKLSVPNGSTSNKEIINSSTPCMMSSSDSEEIKYGPGIVHKLRDRYINITLREAATNNFYGSGNRRPPLSNLRRASSLDNILDDAPSRRDSKDDSEGVTTAPSVVNNTSSKTPRFIKKTNEYSSSSTARVSKVNRQESMKRVRSMETLLSFDDKTTLSTQPSAPILVNENIVIIEQTHSTLQTRTPVPLPRKRTPSGSIASEDELPPPDVVRQTRQKFERRSISTTSPPTLLNKKPILSPKPNNFPVAPPLPQPRDVTKITTAMKPTTVKRKTSPPVANNKSNVTVTPTKTKSPSPPPLQTNGTTDNNLEELEENIKLISPKALENIRKNGFSFEIKPTHNSPKNLSHLPIINNSVGDISPKQIGVIRPITKPPPTPSVNNVEDEKNRINNVKSEKLIVQETKVTTKSNQFTPPNFAQPIVVPSTPSPAVLRTTTTTTTSPPTVLPVKQPQQQQSELWGNRTARYNDHGSTQSFNFTDKKIPIPTYIKNDGTIRSSSVVDDQVDTGPPSPILPVEVIGGNVLINGRSSMRTKPKANKLRITFDDSLTMTFQYPSEASLMLDEANLSETSTSFSNADMSGPAATSRSPLQPLPSGSGSLASYTPSKILLTENTFELGVTRAASDTPILYLDNPSSQEESSSDFLLKPAEDADTVTWSAETASDLLF